MSRAVRFTATIFFAFLAPAHAQAIIPTLNQWTQTAPLTDARAQACTVVLNGGGLLVAGGMDASGPVATVDVYGTDGVFAPGVPMTKPRADAACVTMNDGRVLITGGNDGNGSLKTAEIFDPSSNQWTPTGDLALPREAHQMAVTAWGVWVAGGTNDGVIDGTLELFNAATGQFQALGALNTLRTEFALAASGRNLIVAGGTDGVNTLSSVEIYDGALGTLRVAGSMLQARKDFSAAALQDGTVLMTGGLDANGAPLSTTEIFDPAKEISSAGPPLLAPRANHSAYAMAHNGSVLIYGGTGTSGVLGTTEIYTPWTGAFSQGSQLNTARRDEAKAVLRAGSYLVAGGRNDAGLVASSELFRFATIATDKDDYAPGTAVKISGSGWVPGEQVLVSIAALPIDQRHIEFTGAAIADGAGNIQVPGFTVDKSHLGMNFLMTAVGSQSEAQSRFSDGVDPTFTYQFSPVSGSATPGQSATFTVTVGPNPAGTGPQPTGDITVYTDGALTTLKISGAACSNLTKQCTLSSGANNTAVATVTIDFIPAGTTGVSVAYSGDTNYNAEVPNSNYPAGGGAPIVNYTAPGITISSLTGPASIQYGSQQAYTATVCISSTGVSCDTAGNLAGQVQFFVNGAPSGNPVPAGNQNQAAGTATASFVPGTPLNAGSTYAITATYQNDSNNLSSNSNTVNTTVSAQQAPFTLSMSGGGVSNTGTVSAGVQLTFTATYTGGVTTAPTGQIAFYNSNNGGTPAAAPVCTAALSAGVATCNATSISGGPAGLAPGMVALAISYNSQGNTNYTLGAATAYTFTITPANTATTLTASLPELGGTVAYPNDVVTLTATVATQGVNLKPGGAVAIMPPVTNARNSTCGTPTSGATTANSASYSCTFVAAAPVPLVGTTVTASAAYAGDSYTQSSTLASPTQLPVEPDPTTTTITATSADSPNPTNPLPTLVGHTITLTATTKTTNGVQPNAAAISIMPPQANSANSTCGAPTAGASTANSVAVSCTFTVTAPLGTGIVSASAAYAGDTPSGTAASSGTDGNIPIQGAATATTLTYASDNAPNPTEIGRTVTLNATVSTTTAGSRVQPNFNAITITPPVNNSSSSSCAAPTHLAGLDTATSITVSCTFVITGPFPSGSVVTASANYNGDTTGGTAASAGSKVITVTKAVTMTSLTVSAGQDSLNAVQLGRSVTLTATAQTLSNGTGVWLAPAGTFIFTLPQYTYLSSASCGGNTLAITPAGNQMTVTPYSNAATAANQGTTTVTCTFVTVPPSATAALGTNDYSVVYKGDSVSQFSGPAQTSIITVKDSTQILGNVSTTVPSNQLTAPSGSCNTPYNFYYGQTFSLGAILFSTTGLPGDGAQDEPSKSVSFTGNGLNYVVPIVPTSGGGLASITLPSGLNVIPSPGCYSLNPGYPAPGADPFYATATAPGSANPPAPLTFSVAKTGSITTVTPILTNLAKQPNLSVAVNYDPTMSSGGVPSGPVQVVLDGVAATGTLSPSTNCPSISPCGLALFTLPTGTYSAQYLGDANFLPSNSLNNPNAAGGSGGAIGITASSSVNLAATPNPAPLGQTVVLTATVNGLNANSVPTGTVQFLDNGVVIAVVPLVAAVAIYNDASLTPGAHAIIAIYSGDGTYPSSSFSIGVTVAKPMPSTSFSSNPMTAVYGQQVTVTVRFTGSIQGSALPAGTVQFLNNGVSVGSPVTIVNGVATLTLNTLPPAANNIGVTYSPANNSSFAGVTRNVGMVNVTQAQTTTALTAAVNGSQITLAAAVVVIAPGAGTPTGTVNFNDSITGALLGAAPLSTSGAAAITIPITDDPIVAMYSGDTDFMGSTSPTSAAITVLNAASYMQDFSPGTIATVFGANLTVQTIAGSFPLATTLGGDSVIVTDSAGVPRGAPLFYVSPSQLSFLIPASTAPGTATVTVTTPSGSLTAPIDIVASGAALFTANASGTGPLAAQVFSYAPNGEFSFVNTAMLSGTSYVNAAVSLSPATNAYYLILYGTGFDNTGTVTVEIGGQTFTPSYFGPQGAYSGLDQINVPLPQSLAGAGQVNISITVDGQVSNAGTVTFGAAGTN